MRHWLAALWRYLREVTGDAAYDRYLLHACRGQRLSREEFYLDRLARRYGGPSRCC